MAKRLRDPSARLGAKAAAHWRKLETQERAALASRAKENPVVAPQQPRDRNTPTTVDKDTPNYGTRTAD